MHSKAFASFFPKHKHSPCLLENLAHQRNLLFSSYPRRTSSKPLYETYDGRNKTPITKFSLSWWILGWSLGERPGSPYWGRKPFQCSMDRQTEVSSPVNEEPAWLIDMVDKLTEIDEPHRLDPSSPLTTPPDKNSPFPLAPGTPLKPKTPKKPSVLDPKAKEFKSPTITSPLDPKAKEFKPGQSLASNTLPEADYSSIFQSTDTSQLCKTSDTSHTNGSANGPPQPLYTSSLEIAAVNELEMSVTAPLDPKAELIKKHLKEKARSNTLKGALSSVKGAEIPEKSMIRAKQVRLSLLSSTNKCAKLRTELKSMNDLLEHIRYPIWSLEGELFAEWKLRRFLLEE